jgi:DNA-binding CsgD family transcriptional regulator
MPFRLPTSAATDTAMTIKTDSPSAKHGDNKCCNGHDGKASRVVVSSEVRGGQSMSVKTNVNRSDENSSPQIYLSPQQLEVLRWSATGKTTWETSVIMRCTEANVNYHLKRLFEKLQASNKTHAVSIAIQLGLIANN